jgi:hypothetical protein
LQELNDTYFHAVWVASIELSLNPLTRLTHNSRPIFNYETTHGSYSTLPVPHLHPRKSPMTLFISGLLLLLLLLAANPIGLILPVFLHQGQLRNSLATTLQAAAQK